MKPIKVENPYLKGYSVAPYNFVSLPQKAVARYMDPKELPAHNSFKNRDGKELLSGIIEYTLEAKTPIIVSSGEKDKSAFFFTNSSGEYAIPGNTMRGMVRTNSQILSFSNIVRGDGNNEYPESEINDSRFLFRDVAGNGALADKYKKVLHIDPVKRISRSLRAGYIINENNKYYIEESEKLNDIRNYFRLDEIYLRKILDKEILRNIRLMYKLELEEYEKKLKDLNKIIHGKNTSINKQEVFKAKDEKKAILKKCKNNNYQPYNIEISFSLDSKNVRITNIGEKEKYSKKGYLLSGGFIDGKMSHYIVPEPTDSSGRISISTEDITSYKDDLILTKKMVKSNETIISGKEFFDLPKKGHKKPVFFINTDRLHFGFTPYLRMFYSKTILDGVKSSYKDVNGISYTDAIFGFINMGYKVNNKDVKLSYKSRVSFEDAIAHEGAVMDKDTTMKMILAEPKPTSYNLYLKQNINSDKKELKIYEDDFEIRGIKQYWMKNYIEIPDINDGQGDNMNFTIYPLKEGAKFSGRIHFKNLEEDELGLILWALKLENNCYQNIGLAKPYGFGRVEVKDISLKVEDLDKKYEEFSFDYIEEVEVDKYIDIFKKTFSNKYLNGKNIDEQLPIKELMYIKKTLIGERDCNWYRYMTLKEFRYRKVLPTILEYSDMVKKDSGNLNKSRKSQSNQHESIKSKTKRNSQRNYRSQETFGNTLDLSNWNNTKE